MTTQAPRSATLLSGLALGLVAAILWSAAACTEPKYPYDPCERDTDCTSNKICRGSRCETADLSCATDGDCAGGKLCIKGKCQHPVCQDDRDCSAGESCIGGFCGAKNPESTPDQDGGAPTDRPSKDMTSKDGGADSPPQERKQPTICTPNNNGQIERSELLFKLGTSITYREAGSSSSPIPVDLKGTRGNDGELTWDFSQQYPNSSKVVDEILPVAGAWYADLYKDATHSVILERNLKYFGVFQVTDTELLLLGTVSETRDRTKLKYDTPISLFQFPLAVGKKWTSSGTTTGTLSGVPFYRMHETYLFEVDAKGKVKTPAGTFPVVRLKLSLTQQQFSPALFRRTGYSYYFVSECYGVMVTVDSKDYESNPLFTQAARIKRLSE